MWTRISSLTCRARLCQFPLAAICLAITVNYGPSTAILDDVGQRLAKWKALPVELLCDMAATAGAWEEHRGELTGEQMKPISKSELGKRQEFSAEQLLQVVFIFPENINLLTRKGVWQFRSLLLSWVVATAAFAAVIALLPLSLSIVLPADVPLIRKRPNKITIVRSDPDLASRFRLILRFVSPLREAGSYWVTAEPL